MAVAGIASMMFFSLLSCTRKENVPASVLSKEEMVEVLTEIYVVEEKVNRLALRSDSAKKVFETLQGKIFEKAGTQDSIFRKSINYYMNHPKEMELIYTALVDSLNLDEQRESVRNPE